MSQIVQIILDMLGMTRQQQFAAFTGMMLLVFALYAGRQFATQKVFATLYLALGLAFCVFMTTANPRSRFVAGVASGLIVCALFTWYFATRKHDADDRATREKQIL